MNILIDEEFHKLIPPLTEEEHKQLEASILQEGCRDAIVLWENFLIDGHNRYEICKKHNIPFRTINKEFQSKDDAKVWIIKNQFGRRNLTKYDRGLLVLQLEEIFRTKSKQKQREAGGPVPQKSDEPPINTFENLSKLADMSDSTLRNIKKIKESNNPELEKVAREKSIESAIQEIKKEDNKKKREDRKKSEEEAKLPSDIKILSGDFIKVGQEISDNSVDLILTDPPYGREFLGEWQKLSTFAKRILKPSGFLITYSGQLNLNEVMKILNTNLNYYWTISLVHTGTKQLVTPRNIICGWKPILVFQKEPFKKLEMQTEDIIIGTGREKDAHVWQQAEEELNVIIKNFTKPNDTIVDPFAGSGTTLLSIYKNKRKPIGIEIDEGNINIIKSRFKELLKE